MVCVNLGDGMLKGHVMAGFFLFNLADLSLVNA